MSVCQEFRTKAIFLTRTLGLERLPVGVKFLSVGDNLSVGQDSFEQSIKYRYCQALMRAGEGNKIILTVKNLVCPAAAAAFGFNSLVDKLQSGKMLEKMGLFKNKEAARRTMEAIPRLQLGRYERVILSALDRIDYVPDVIVVESQVENIMWLALASYFDQGERLTFNSSIFQASCVDSTLVPFLTQTINTSLGCFGCREATNITSGEALAGIPRSKFDKIVINLELLSQQAIPRARRKNVYRRLINKVADQ